jgi:YD repeat-containing protein
VWSYAHDPDRRLTALTDPLGEETQFGYDDGRLASLTDTKNNTTQWAYDVEGRPTLKTYPDGSTLAYTYEVRKDVEVQVLSPAPMKSVT